MAYQPQYQQQYSDQQPLAAPPMQVGTGGSRNFKNMAIVDGEREWSHDLFGCFADPITCLIAHFAPCIVYGRNRTRYQSLENYGAVNTDTMDGVVGLDCLIWIGAHCIGCPGIAGIIGRGQTRTRYAIHGGACGDFCVTCCCAGCALTQESREIELEEQSLGHPGAGFGN
ncbi:PLAC8-domain-containing protein [Mycena vitilis]|nr:PLAC8-domain-containing protein [Mycena vitilis]